MFFSLILLFACEPEEYFPDVNAYRDADLFGTWRSIHSSSIDSSFYVFTSLGYIGSTSYINNAQIKGFTNLNQIWNNIEGIAEDGWGKIFIADASSSWTKKRSVNEEYYRLSESKDTLYLSHVSLKTKQADKEKPSVYIKNSYNLIFDGPKYVGIDLSK
jgi:hypothetical protein